jgi:hypothetical protein
LPAGGSSQNLLVASLVDRARLPLADLAPLAVFLFGPRWQTALARALKRVGR